MTVGQRTLDLGFAGVGWIGRQRMNLIASHGGMRVAAVADPDAELRDAAAADAPGAAAVASFDELLELELDGIVIATPSALHADQAVAALERGLPVFCQKPLGRDAGEAARVVASARSAGVLLGLDLSYRHTEAAMKVKEIAASGALGDVYAADMVFHNAYGPDKPWFRDRRLAGGGCLIDLGTHLVDLLLWIAGADRTRVRSARVLREGRPLAPDGDGVEDHAIAELAVGDSLVARLACSWWLPAGRDCVFEFALYGTAGAAVMRNVAGSFYDFQTVLQKGTSSRSLVEPPDGWSGRAGLAWAERLTRDRSFDPAAQEFVAVSQVLDGIYRAAR